MTSLTIGTFTRSLPLEIARVSGRLEQAGLAVREISVASSPEQFSALLDGELDLVFTGPDNVLAYSFLPDNPLNRIIGLRVLAGVDRGLGLSLCLAPEGMRSGVGFGAESTLGVDVPTSGFAFVAYALVEQRFGLRPDDYRIEALGSTPKRAQYLVAGGCDASILNAGNELFAIGNGCELVSSVADVGPYVGTVVARLADPAGGKAEAEEVLLRILAEIIAEIHDGAWKPELIRSAQELFGLSSVAAEQHYRVLRSEGAGFIPDGRVDIASMETLIGLREAYRPQPELAGVRDRLPEIFAPGVLDQSG